MAVKSDDVLGEQTPGPGVQSIMAIQCRVRGQC